MNLHRITYNYPVSIFISLRPIKSIGNLNYDEIVFMLEKFSEFREYSKILCRFGVCYIWLNYTKTINE